MPSQEDIDHGKLHNDAIRKDCPDQHSQDLTQVIKDAWNSASIDSDDMITYLDAKMDEYGTSASDEVKTLLSELVDSQPADLAYAIFKVCNNIQ